MGILRHREELLPVTCAVLKDEDRNAFFTLLKKKCGGRVEKIAAAGATTKAVVADWMSGKANVPFHTLQKLSADFNIEAPSVSELRREFQRVVEVRIQPPAKRQAAPAPKKQEERPKKTESPRKKPEQKKKQERRSKPKEKESPQTHRNAGPQIPKLSETTAYWTGATVAAAQRSGDALVFKIDTRVGQNFTRVWAKLSEELFGATVQLKELEEASLPLKGLEDFIDRLELKEGKPGPGAPRWAWSNPNWKLAFLRGVVDASASFTRDPAIKLTGLSERLVQSLQKLLTAHKLATKTPEKTSLVIEGAEDVKRYFVEVGTKNFKLNDQLKAFFKDTEGKNVSTETKAPAAAKKKGRRRGGKGHGRGQQRRKPRAETPGESAAAEFAGSQDCEKRTDP